MDNPRSDSPSEKVLLVDDDVHVAALFKPVVEGLGASCVVAASCAQARAAFEDGELACALIRPVLPDGDGLDLLAELSRRSPGTELLVLAGASNMRTAVVGLRLGAVDYLVEPYVPEVVQHRVSLSLQRRRMLAEASRMEQQLLQADRMASVGTLAAGVAHEINAPLSHITLNVEMLDRELGRLGEALGPNGDALAHRHLSAARRRLVTVWEGGERVRLIVRDLRSAARGGNDVRGPVDLHQVLDTALQISSSEIRWRAHVVKQYGVIPNVEGNRTRLEQVFVNLLINAAQAIPDGQPARNEIRVVTRCEPTGEVVVEIHDTGSGIPTENLEKLFDPFFTTKPVGVGTGLGLPICQGIITALGGAIEVISTVGKGSCFSVQLPPLGRPVPVSPAAGRAVDRRVRVMLIEEDPGVSQLISDVLAPDHEVVPFAATGPETICAELSRGGGYDVILCDLMMKGMLGAQLYRKLVGDGSDHAQRLIFLTDSFAPKARAFLARVPNHRLEKPFHIQELCEAVSSVAG